MSLGGDGGRADRDGGCELLTVITQSPLLPQGGPLHHCTPSSHHRQYYADTRRPKPAQVASVGAAHSGRAFAYSLINSDITSHHHTSEQLGCCITPQQDIHSMAPTSQRAGPYVLPRVHRPGPPSSSSAGSSSTAAGGSSSTGLTGGGTPAGSTPARTLKGLPRWLLALPLLTLLVTVSGGRRAVDARPNPHQGRMQLTPWWPTTMAAGETLVLDCGVFVGGGDAPTPDIRWTDAGGRVVNSSLSNPRMKLVKREKNNVNDSNLSAYRVLTLTIHDLQPADSGVYVCVTNRTSQEGAPVTDSRNVSLQVLQPDVLCTMEGEDLCGWRDLVNNGNTKIGWRRLDGSDEISLNRSSGRYDHTYGASKHIGHFLDLDRFVDLPPEDGVARLQSPLRAATESAGCFHFWYIYYGNDHEYLQVAVLPANSSHEDEDQEKVLFHVNNTNTPSVWVGDWTLAAVNLPAQSRDYHVVLEAMTCVGRCRKSRFIALDDFRFFPESCENIDEKSVWPNRELAVRLVNGSTKYQGRVEILHDAMWGTVCSTQFGTKEAKVICNYLGFKGEGAQGRRKSPDGGADDNVIIWLQRLGCNGTERDLGACIAKGETWGTTETCSHTEDARVLCGDVAPSPPPTLPVSMDTEKTSSTSAAPSTTTSSSSTPGTTITATPAAVTSAARQTTEETHDVTTVPAQPSSTAEITSGPKVTTSSTPGMTPTPAKVTSSGDLTSEPALTTVENSGGPQVENGTAESSVMTSSPAHNVSNTTSDTGRSGGPTEARHGRRNTGAALGISLTVLLISAGVGVWMYRKRKNRRKSKYIVFSNPKYSREHLPANDISLDSPLTSGSSILA